MTFQQHREPWWSLKWLSRNRQMTWGGTNTRKTVKHNRLPCWCCSLHHIFSISADQREHWKFPLIKLFTMHTARYQLVPTQSEHPKKKVTCCVLRFFLFSKVKQDLSCSLHWQHFVQSFIYTCIHVHCFSCVHNQQWKDISGASHFLN